MELSVRLYSLKEVAEICAVPYKNLHYYVSRGRLPQGVRLGTNRAYTADEVRVFEAFFQKRSLVSKNRKSPLSVAIPIQ